MQDEEAELLAELARIKKEREEEAAKRAATAERAARRAAERERVERAKEWSNEEVRMLEKALDRFPQVRACVRQLCALVAILLCSCAWSPRKKR